MAGKKRGARKVESAPKEEAVTDNVEEVVSQDAENDDGDHDGGVEVTEEKLAPKKRGRGNKDQADKVASNDNNVAVVPKKRGRGGKMKKVDEAAEDSEGNNGDIEIVQETSVPKKRGRATKAAAEKKPKKEDTDESENNVAEVGETSQRNKKGGRRVARKDYTEKDEETVEVLKEKPAPKKRGRPGRKPKKNESEEEEEEDFEEPKSPRGAKSAKHQDKELKGKITKELRVVLEHCRS